MSACVVAAEGTDFEVTFECKSPVFGDKLQLKGFNCFEAASYCAAVSAAKRASQKASSKAPRSSKPPALHPAATAVPPVSSSSPVSPSTSSSGAHSDSSSSSLGNSRFSRGHEVVSSSGLAHRMSHDVVTQVGRASTSPSDHAASHHGSSNNGPAGSVLAALRKLGLGRGHAHKEEHSTDAHHFGAALTNLFRRRSPTH